MPGARTSEGVPGHGELDVRLAWQASERRKRCPVGQNLLHKRHIEGGGVAPRGALQRGVYGQAAWEF